MTYTKLQNYLFKCDKCSTESINSYSGTTIEPARNELHATEGWERNQGYDICKDCADKEKL